MTKTEKFTNTLYTNDNLFILNGLNSQSVSTGGTPNNTTKKNPQLPLKPNEKAKQKLGIGIRNLKN